MKKSTLILAFCLLFTTNQSHSFSLSFITDPVESLFNKALSAAKKAFQPLTNKFNGIKNTINNMQTAIDNNVGDIETQVNNYILPSVNNLIGTVSNPDIAGNIKILEESAGKIETKINAIHPPQISLDNLANLNLTGFFNQINEVYDYINTPLQATANIIHIMYTTLSYASEASTHSGRLCNSARNIVNAFNFDPVNKVLNIDDISTSLQTLGPILETSVPTTLGSIQGASGHMNKGFDNLYKNIGNTLHALQKQVIALQKAAMALHKLGNVGSVASPPPPPPPPAGPSLPGTISQSNNGTIPPPPPLPAGWN